MKYLFWILLTMGSMRTFAQSAPTFNGKTLIDVSTISPWTFSARASGWYRIAKIPDGNRGNATFELRENADHSTLRFEVGVNFSSAAGSSFTLTSHSYWSAPTFTKLRLVTKDTYSDVFLEVYVEPHNNDGMKFCAYLLNPLADNDWGLVNWLPGSIPAGYSNTEFQTDNLFSVGNGLKGNIFSVNRDGNVGIGTSLPNARLAVNGAIRAKEIKVENTAWPDYVFEKDFVLPSLEITEQQIKTAGHLPRIPSAAEVKANGLDLGEMNSRLLQKIEELTLHLIELNKKVTRQQLQLEKLSTPNQ